MEIEGKEVTVGCPPGRQPCDEEWKSFMFHFHDFANLSTTRDHFILSPKFTCNGHQWLLYVYPGGDNYSAEGQVSIFLQHLSKEAITASYGVELVDKFGKTSEHTIDEKHTFPGQDLDDDEECWGWTNFISRSVILDKSKNLLDDKGTLTVVVSMWEEVEEPTTAFVPKNPFVKMMQGMLNDEATADICFEVGTAGDTEEDDGAKRAKTTSSFYAHHNILRVCAPMLASICGSSDSGGVVTAQVNDVKPEIFQHLLSYVYGGTIPVEELKAHAKDIIAAADKYSIVNLKLEAEAAYVDATKISLDNAMDNLLYADSRNLALLKEAVMNFLADNHHEAVAHINFADCPGHVVKDLLVVFSRHFKADANGNVDKLNTLSVSALRKKLDKMGLEVDGSREAMIESIKSHSGASLA